MSYVYLGSPYTDKSKLVQHNRYLQVSRVVADMLCHGVHVYSPIVHCHELAKRFRLPGDFQFWQDYNYAMLERSSAFHLLELTGWNDSKGLKAEIKFALEKAIPIIRMSHE